MFLDPYEIRYSQDSIAPVFRCRRNIGDTLDELCSGLITVNNIPKISVVKRNGLWVTADNRRLWVFRNLRNLGKCTTVPVWETSCIDPSKLTSFNNGRSIRVRGKPGGSWHYRSNDAIKETTSARPQRDTLSVRTTLHDSNKLYTGGHDYSNLFQSLNILTDNCPELDPEEIRFTKATIKSNTSNVINPFTRVPENEITLELLKNKTQPMAIIKAFKLHWALGDENRKLLSFKEAKKTRFSVKIKVKVTEDRDKVLSVLREDNPELSLLEILSFGKTITCVP